MTACAGNLQQPLVLSHISRDGTQRFTSEWRRGFRYAALTIRNRPAAVQIARSDSVRNLSGGIPRQFSVLG